MPIANCERCIYFVPIDKADLYFSKDQIDRMIAEAKQKRGNVKIYGFCIKFGRAVTYLVGSCHGFEPIQMVQRTLFDYVKVRK